MMQFPDRYAMVHLCVEGAVCATAGYVGAWFAAGPKSALSDPRAGAIMALATRVIYAMIGKQVFEWAQKQLNSNKNQAIMTAITVAAIGALAVTRLCGYAVNLDDITVLAIGLIVGIPVALIGIMVVSPLIDRVLHL